MGLLDQLAGQVLGSLAGGAQGGGQSPLLQLVLNLIQNSEGGLGGLLSKLHQAGLGDQVSSWVGTGQNLPISAEQLGQALGGVDGLGDMAAQLGLPQEQVAGQLAQLLPQVIDGLTPNGQLPEAGGDLLGQNLSSVLGSLLGKA
ncbi:MAG: DUF937 domain-containing protein [Zoogloea sp.]|nr:DUF937 domain-containing protein [Zoogloea sp.]